MIIVNLANLNSANGMFWYAVDKIRTLNQTAVNVLVKPHLAPLISRELPNAIVKETGRWGAAGQIACEKFLRRSSAKIVTFTSHPLPFVPDQTIAFYDDYPFEGRAGKIKLLLFKLGAATSKCRIGIINRSLSIPFLAGCGIPEERIFFDSAFPAIDLRHRRNRPIQPGTPIRVGLVGTDSRKKNYAELFTAIIKLGRERDIKFFLYGSANEYVEELRHSFRSIDLSLIPSDDVDLKSFFDRIDYLVSAARSEGYGRPMGLAATLGVPMFLVRSPVFLEFFGEHATFFENILEAMQYIFDHRPPASIASRSLPGPVPDKSPFFA